MCAFQRILWVVGYCVAIPALTGPLVAQHLQKIEVANPMPQRLEDPRGVEEPFFLAAAAALNQDGTINWSAFSEGAGTLLERYLARFEGCMPYMEIAHSEPRPEYANLREALRRAPFALAGRVTGLAFGFRHFQPGTLIRLEVETALRGEVGRNEVFVFLPVGKFAFGPHQICSEKVEYASLPKINDRLLITTASEPLQGSAMLFASPLNLVVIAQEGLKKEGLPKPFRNTETARLGQSMEELLV